MIEIVASGPLATVQDGGRIGHGALGVPRAGAFDRSAHRLANRLVGNVEGAATIEFTAGGLQFTALHAVTVAMTGAPCPGLDWGRAITLTAGTAIRLGAPTSGLRSYLAMRGGIEIDPVLGSRSTDLLSGLGPAPITAGDRLDVGVAIVGDVHGSTELAPPSQHSTAHLIRAIRGPRTDWFAPDALGLLTTAAWTARADSNRIGIRLDGPPLRRAIDAELPSEPTRPGAIQVPTEGLPIIFGPDAPVTGGYPVIAVVADIDLDVLAQARPGDTVRFAIS